MDKKLLDIVACPCCKGSIIEFNLENKEFLKCERCKVLYPIKEGIPVLLIEEGIKEEKMLKNDE